MAAVVTHVALDTTLALVTRAREGDRLALERLAVRYQATIHITAINEWLHSLRNRP